jgi:hypothetical protein
MTFMHERAVTPDAGTRAHVAGGQVSGLLARKVVDRLPSAGDPLTAAVCNSPGAAFGHDLSHDLSHVRVHHDGYAADTARVFGARALTAGQHVLLGAGTSGATTDRVLAHEVGHAASQARTGDPVVQLDAIDQVQDLLSYGVLDWAVTDSEAMESLALLNALPDAQLTAGLARLESKYVDRLLDNLPDAARSGPGYQRIVQALGASRTAGQAVEDLSYGLFDLAVTDSDVIGVYNTLVNLQPAQQETFLVALEKAERFGRLVSNSNGGHLSLYLHPWMKTLTPGRLTPDQQKLLRTVVDNTSDLATITLAAQVRFNVTVGPSTVPERTPTPWDAGQLKRTYLVLDQLPEAHTATNRELVKLSQYTRPAAGGLETGAYYAGELTINAQGSADAYTIRHETGHSVDANIGWSSGPEPAKPERGGWHTYYATHAATATDMIADAKSGIAGLTAPQQADVIAEIATSMTNRSTTGQLARVRARPWYVGLAAPVKTAVTDDPTFEAVDVGLKTPWYQAADGGTHLDTHIYQESYTPTWVRYEHQARNRKVSDYQFRSPGEWFADTYAWYYEPDSRGKGMKLNDKDPDTKAWFDTHVDPIVGTR